LSEDIEALYADESFRLGEIGEKLTLLAAKFGFPLNWIPKRKIAVSKIHDDFRGSMMKPLAQRVLDRFGNGATEVTAALIGDAARFTAQNNGAWADLGNEYELFQFFKQLWHTVAYYGREE
jgi:hypothetical protein